MRSKADNLRLFLGVLFLTLPAMAKCGGGTGVPDDPYLIYNAEQMNAVGAQRDDWDRHFKLMADIDLSGYVGTDFNIIGIGHRNAFTGVFDGSGHAISNFSYRSTNGGYRGLFRCVSRFAAQIRAVRLIDPNVETTAGSCVGSLVGFVDSGVIMNCTVEGGSVSGSRWIGCLVGYSRGKILDCHSACSVSGNEGVGGVVGWNWGGKMTDCYASVSVSGYEEVGGLVGRKSYLDWPGVYPGQISRCYSTGSVSADRYAGGLVEYSYIGVVDASFRDVETSGQPDSDGGAGKMTAEMQTAGTFLDAGWDFVSETENGTEDLWRILEGREYPHLWWEPVEDGE